MIIIETSVWIPLLNGMASPKVDQARSIIDGPEDVGVPGIILDEILRGLRADPHFRAVRDMLLNNFTYLESPQSVFIRSAEIYRSLRRTGRTVRSAADCLIAACAIEHSARLLEDDVDFRAIARVASLALL